VNEDWWSCYGSAPSSSAIRLLLRVPVPQLRGVYPFEISIEVDGVRAGATRDSGPFIVVLATDRVLKLYFDVILVAMKLAPPVALWLCLL